MPDDLLSIGALARAGGPPVSALRFYDAAGVLRPAHVDPATGYRWYTSAQVHTARLVSSLRQAGLPLADLTAVLESPQEAHAVLERHRRRLEEDLAAARAHLDAADGILREPATCTVASRDLTAAAAAVRHAVGNDPEWPGLAGVLLHLDGTTLRLVACDRARIAVATVPARETSGPPARVVASLAHLGRLSTSSLPETGTVTLGLHDLELVSLHDEPLGGPYPDYEQLLRSGSAPSTSIATDELLDAAQEAADIVALRLDGGRVDLAAPGDRESFGYSRTFLLDAVRAARSDVVALSLDERNALSVAAADRPDDIGLLMPIRLHR